jgi:hypothetical protein
MKKSTLYTGFFILALVLLVAYQYNNLMRVRMELAMQKNNMNALKDTVEKTTNALGQAQFEKSTLITTKKDLANFNLELFNEMKAQRGQVAYLQTVVATLATGHDTPTVIMPQITGSTDTTISYSLPWTSFKRFDSSNFRSLAGTTNLTINKTGIKTASSEISDDQIGFNIVTGLEKKKDHYEIFIRSNYPNFNVTRIDGAYIPQKDLFPPQKLQKWTIGPSINFGIGAGGTSIPTVKPVFYGGIGISLTRKVISF